jgi:hypothetical protein
MVPAKSAALMGLKTPEGVKMVVLDSMTYLSPFKAL